MRLTRTENTKRNIIVGEIDKISGVILPFIVRTMIIHLIGADYLGLTSLFYSILQMLNLMEMGFGTAIIYSLYKPIAENDDRKINALLQYYKKIYRTVGIAVGVTGICMLPFLPHLIRGNTPPDINIYLLYLIYLLNTCVNFFIFPNRKAILTAHQRDDISGRIHIFTQLGMYLGQAFFIWFARDYYLYALMMPISSVIYSLLCGWRAKKQYPDYRAEGELEKSEYREIRKQVAGLMIRKVAMLSRNAFDSMFVSAFLGLTITAVYGNYYYIMDSVVMIIAVIKTSMAGGVGNSIAMDSIEKNRKDMHMINFLFMWISGWCSICLLCLYQPFMRLWAGEEMTLPVGYAVIFAVYFYVLKMSDIRTLYSESAGIWWQARYISVLEAAANLLLNWLLIRWMGLFGIILATLISYFVFNFAGGAVLLYKYYFTEGGLERFFLAHGFYAAAAFAVGGTTYGVVSLLDRIPAPGFWHSAAVLAGKAGICLILPNLLFLCIYGRTAEFKESRKLLERVIHR
ncbi:MAG: hypothetical protein Q4B22_04510 [Eubacteriales bacterium]|nr:hypothetical protein [Eubacteriales bacterium]